LDMAFVLAAPGIANVPYGLGVENVNIVDHTGVINVFHYHVPAERVIPECVPEPVIVENACGPCGYGVNGFGLGLGLNGFGYGINGFVPNVITPFNTFGRFPARRFFPPYRRLY